MTKSIKKIKKSLRKKSKKSKKSKKKSSKKIRGGDRYIKCTIRLFLQFKKGIHISFLKNNNIVVDILNLKTLKVLKSIPISENSQKSFISSIIYQVQKMDIKDINKDTRFTEDDEIENIYSVLSKKYPDNKECQIIIPYINGYNVVVSLTDLRKLNYNIKYGYKLYMNTYIDKNFKNTEIFYILKNLENLLPDYKLDLHYKNQKNLLNQYKYDAVKTIIKCNDNIERVKAHCDSLKKSRICFGKDEKQKCYEDLKEFEYNSKKFLEPIHKIKNLKDDSPINHMDLSQDLNFANTICNSAEFIINPLKS